MTTTPPHHMRDDPSPLRGALAGLVAGLVASLVMDSLQQVVTAASLSAGGGEPATEKAAARVTKAATGRPLTKEDRPLGGHLVHYGLGASLGVLYGIAAEYRSEVTAGKGAAFGLGAALVLDNAAVPIAGLGDPPWRTDVGTQAYSAASHLVFGATAELMRSGVRHLLTD